MIYLDTAALMKLVRRERESDALVEWLDDRQDALLVSSTLVEVEAARALRPPSRRSCPRFRRCPAASRGTRSIRSCAARQRHTTRRHFAPSTRSTWQRRRSCWAPGSEAFVTYDVRLLSAARGFDMSVASPGRIQVHHYRSMPVRRTSRATCHGKRETAASPVRGGCGSKPPGP